MRFVYWSLCLAMMTSLASAVEIEDHKHLGVATCASSTCHGKTGPQKDKHVALNEYRTWLQDDLHAQAYKVLENAKSKGIAAKLGIANAATAKICLDCHSDNVPAAKRGPKFQMSDGIGCEACHGGAEKWIESHAATNATHKANLAEGMYPTEAPMDRARLCLSCHIGTRDRLATHAIMGAGHPRLSFEMEAFTANQPAHYVVDADYIERKGKIEGVNLWLTGQFESARRLLTLLQSEIAHPAGMFPELAFYDCYSCHHPMKQVRWTRERAGNGIGPGTLRLQTYNLIAIQAAGEALGEADANQLAAARIALVRAGQTDAAAVK
ncbi:MAG TPA: multiheme c-type cytochrome, partial [Steroidobacteraceae bacterium]|nr:multiheme c-type cytochrome [Steroidobacteraceae bacterium]